VLPALAHGSAAGLSWSACSRVRCLVRSGPTLFARISTWLRFSPCWFVHSSVLVRPTTMTLLPLARLSPMFSASLPNAVQRQNVVPSSSQVPCSLRLRSVSATRNFAMALPLLAELDFRVCDEVPGDRDGGHAVPFVMSLAKLIAAAHEPAVACCSICCTVQAPSRLATLAFLLICFRWLGNMPP
jgi:hypothetical protein